MFFLVSGCRLNEIPFVNVVFLFNVDGFVILVEFIFKEIVETGIVEQVAV